jgi:photosystem II stability/assembly factor-like uncharacterized protein
MAHDPIWRSKGGARRGKPLAGGAPETHELSISIDSADVDSNGNIYAGKVDKVYKSTDNGTSWSLIYTLPGSPQDVRRIFCDSRNYVFASGYRGTDYGLYRSTNGGSSWTKVHTTDTNTCVWAMEEDASGNLYIGEYSWDGAGQAQIWKSTDGGANWVQKYSNNAGAQDHIHDLRYDVSSGWLYATYGDVGGNIIIRSKDAGENWATIATAGLRPLAIAFAGGKVYVGSDAGSGNKIYSFTDAGGASVTLDTAYTFDAGQDCQVFAAGESGSKVFFGTWTPTSNGSVVPVIVKYNGTDWTVDYTHGAAIGYDGYGWVSRHARSGVFYFNHGNDYGIKYTP